MDKPKIVISLVALLFIVAAVLAWVPAHWYMPDHQSPQAANQTVSERCENNHMPRQCEEMANYEAQEPRRIFGKRLGLIAIIFAALTLPSLVVMTNTEFGPNADRQKRVNAIAKWAVAITATLSVSCLVTGMLMTLWH